MTGGNSDADRATIDGRIAVERSSTATTAIHNTQAAVARLTALLLPMFRAGHAAGAAWMSRKLNG